ncbi:hypothetical protein [Bacillus thuringiensis]|uniref:hypothetical protein n=1 Tax=Bacillus thuringiensis TaxID=1428 RepID=UPI002868C40E|nr:hypothetical protein [Bacillus thuringiensis]
MLINKVTDSFLNQFFNEIPVKNDVFTIESNQKIFIFESANVIDMIKKFSPKEQEYAKRQLKLYVAQKREINNCLEEIATDYVRRYYGKH